MNPITRRALLRSTALAPVVFALAACGTTGASATLVPAGAAAIQAIGQYLEGQFLPSLASAGATIPASTLATINKIVGAIGGVAAGVSTATTQSQGASTLQTIENFVNQLAPIAAPFLSMIPGAGPILTIALAALPAAEGLVNMGATLLSPLAQQIAAMPVPSTPTAAPARLTPAKALAIVLAKTGR